MALVKKQTPQTPAITPVKVELPRRGRGEVVSAELIGELKERDGKPIIDTAMFRGQPVNPLLEFVRKAGVDVAEALAAGYNALTERHARGVDVPTLADRLLAEGLAPTPEMARIYALHGRGLARRFGATDDQVLELIKGLQSADETPATE